PLKPGLYTMRIGLTTSGTAPNIQYRSPLEPAPVGNPLGNRVTVGLEYLHAPSNPNAFYYLPLDETVGFPKAGQASGDRLGYGTVFSKDTFAITTDTVIKPSDSGMTGGLIWPKTVAVTRHTDFENGQVTNRGRLLSLDTQGGKLEWAQLTATPVLARLEGATGQFYYRMRKSGLDGPVMRKNQFFGWKPGAASASDTGGCTAQTELDHTIIPGACSNAGADAFGVYKNVNGARVLQSIFYTPGPGYSIETLCGAMATPREQAPSIGLDFLTSTDHLEGLFSRIKEGSVCVVADTEQRLSFFWNEKELFKAFSASPPAGWNASKTYSSLASGVTACASD
ncbi:MAG: hypothetical protein Q7R47_07050, partial [Candidatus Diapherotrites archaeon]|nr:hypothetical protein [Candidatus Diapherotrites archaeon]